MALLPVSLVLLLLAHGLRKAFVQGKIVAGSCWILFGVLVAQLAVSVGSICVPVPFAIQKKPRVFVVGLSRTGTTSISQALSLLGYHPYHSLPPLLTWKDHKLLGFDEYWANAYDAHTDLPTALVFKQLAHAYPNAKFILTQRAPEKWAAAMVKFCKEVDVIFYASQQCYDWSIPLLDMQPADDLFNEAYGTWRNNTKEDWIRIYEEHEAAVFEELRDDSNKRFWALDITKGDATLRQLAEFLGVDLPSGISGQDLFPKAEVFKYTFTVQPIHQLQNLMHNFRQLAEPSAA